MRLRGADMEPYQVTADDALWLARAVEAEGPVQSQVAATLVNGFCFVRARRGYKGSLASWIRAYAQPCNPRWYTNGDLFLASIADKSEAEKAAARTQASKRERVHSARRTFTQATQAAVSAALNGIGSTIPPTATDYAAANVNASSKGYTALADSKGGVNRLWHRPGAETWAGYIVDATDAWPWLVGVLLVGAVLAAAKWGQA
jgi:hypothetical protein